MPHVTEEIWSNLPARESRLIVAPWPECGRREPTPARSTRVQEAAAIFRRSGVLAALEGEEQRIFDAVVKPGTRDRRTANVEAEIASGCARRSRAPRGCSRTSTSCRTRRRRRRGRAREARALPARARCRSAAEYVESLSPWPKDGFGLERIGRCSPSSGILSWPTRRSTSSARTGSRRRRARSRRCSPARGCRVGAYLSPHVRGWGERIRVRRGRSRLRGGDRARAAAGRGARGDAVRGADRRGARRVRGGRVDVAVVEAGLGGRHDATNVLRSPVSGADERRARAHRRPRRRRARRSPRRSSPSSSRARPSCSASRSGRRSRARTAPHRSSSSGPQQPRPCARRGRGVPRPAGRRPRRRRAARAGSSGSASDPLEIWDGAHNLAGLGYVAAAASERALRASSPRSSPTRTSTGCWPLCRRSAARLVATTSSSTARAVRPAELAAAASPYFAQVERSTDPAEALAHARALRRAGPRHRLPLPPGRSGQG